MQEHELVHRRQQEASQLVDIMLAVRNTDDSSGSGQPSAVIGYQVSTTALLPRVVTCLTNRIHHFQ